MSLKNQAALSAAAQMGSYGTRQGPLKPADVAGALVAYGLIASQYVQMLDLVSQIAGPALTPVGAPPAAPLAVVTVNATHNLLSAGDMAVAPSQSSVRMVSTRAGVTPYMFIDRAISAPITMLTSGTMPALILNGNALAVPTYVGATALFNNVMASRVEIFAGTNPVGQVTTWGAFITNVARPVLDAYQAQLRLMFNRLRATQAANAAQESAIWLALHGVTPDSTQIMLDQLKVLRDPAGNPLYLPATQNHSVRDTLLLSVLAINQQFGDSPDFGA